MQWWHIHDVGVDFFVAGGEGEGVGWLPPVRLRWRMGEVRVLRTRVVADVVVLDMFAVYCGWWFLVIVL